MLNNQERNYFKTQTVLIAEDHNPTRNLFKQLLEDFFNKVIIATNGLECLEKVKYESPNLLITDIQMPKKSGIECIEHIRTQDYNLPIIVISSFSNDEYLLKAANLDIQGYLLKPLDINTLEKTLSKIYNYSNNNSPFEITSTLCYEYSNSLLIFNNQKIPLTKKENDFLHILIQNKDIIVTYEDFEYELWGKNEEVMSLNSLRTLVKKLRIKIPTNFIKNVSKTGYKFSIEEL